MNKVYSNNKDMNDNKDIDKSDYEDNRNKDKNKDKAVIKEIYFEKEYRLPPKKPCAKHRERLIANNIWQEPVDTNSNS
jgi:hypothetical protein